MALLTLVLIAVRIQLINRLVTPVPKLKVPWVMFGFHINILLKSFIVQHTECRSNTICYDKH